MSEQEIKVMILVGFLLGYYDALVIEKVFLLELPVCVSVVEE